MTQPTDPHHLDEPEEAAGGLQPADDEVTIMEERATDFDGSGPDGSVDNEV